MVAILTGGDEVFCSGADLADLEALSAEIEGDNGQHREDVPVLRTLKHAGSFRTASPAPG